MIKFMNINLYMIKIFIEFIGYDYIGVFLVNKESYKLLQDESNTIYTFMNVTNLNVKQTIKYLIDAYFFIQDLKTRKYIDSKSIFYYTEIMLNIDLKYQKKNL